MGKKECILKYAQKQTPRDLSSLGFTIIKTEEHFKQAYEMHDVGANYVVQKYLHKKYTIHPLGVDLRKHEVIIEDELPDYIVEKNGKVFCFDVKSKSSIKYFGWANERAIVSYKKLVKACNVPIFLIFTQVVSGKVRGEIRYSNVEDEPIKKKQAWDGNIVWIFRWEKGLGDI